MSDKFCLNLDIMSTRSEAYYQYIKSPSWRALRLNLFKTRGKKCERCGSKNMIEVHHLTYVRLGNEKMSDLEVLCNVCHAKEHDAKPKEIKKPKVKAIVLKGKKKKNPVGKNSMQRLSKKQLISQGYSPASIQQYQKWWNERV